MLENVTTLTNKETVLGASSGKSQVRTNMTFLQIAGRGTTPLLSYTVLGLDPETNKLVPWKSNLSTGALYTPCIYIGDSISGETIVSGDVTGLDIIVGDTIMREDALVFELGGDTLDTSFGTAPNNTTLRTLFSRIGIWPQLTVLPNA